MSDMAKEELEEVRSKLPSLEETIRFMLIPKDPEDAKNVVMELRAGTGGDEASILLVTYIVCTQILREEGWKVSIVDLSEGTAGGFKEIIIEVSGNSVYGTLNLSLVCIVCNVFPKPKPKVVFLLLLQLWFCQKRRSLTLKSI